MLTLLTATGCRPQAWVLCERWMARQTYTGPVRWVIVDDGAEAQPITFRRDGWTLDVIRPAPYWQAGQNTQARNLKFGLVEIGASERVAVIEDDDWYAPDWLATIDAALDHVDLVGEPYARYYNVARKRGRELRNKNHASLCASACKGSGLHALRRAVASGQMFIDLRLWKASIPKRLLPGHRVVGIKGLAGRGGIGMGHRDDFRGADDAGGQLLRAWLGNDAEAYR